MVRVYKDYFLGGDDIPSFMIFLAFVFVDCLNYLNVRYHLTIVIYIRLKISLVMLYKIVVVTFFEYLPQQAPQVIVLLNFENKLALYWQWLE